VTQRETGLGAFDPIRPPLQPEHDVSSAAGCRVT